jgi:hypothetical protein
MDRTVSLLVASSLLLLMACGAEEGHAVSGSVKIICGGAATPCNFTITAPLELAHAEVYLDGVETTMLFPNEIEHPLRNLLLHAVGFQPTSDAAIATCHLPAGTHELRIIKPGYQPIDQAVVRIGGTTEMQKLHISRDQIESLPIEPTTREGRDS